MLAARHVGVGGNRARCQRHRQGCAAASADGVRGRGTEVDRDQPGGERGVAHIDRSDVAVRVGPIAHS
jgi:hypothetical protein